MPPAHCRVVHALVSVELNTQYFVYLLEMIRYGSLNRKTEGWSSVDGQIGSGVEHGTGMAFTLAEDDEASGLRNIQTSLEPLPGLLL